jgi:hypothetical protein
MSIRALSVVISAGASDKHLSPEIQKLRKPSDIGRLCPKQVHFSGAPGP